MEKQIKSYQNGLVFALFLLINPLLDILEIKFYDLYVTWVNPYTIPIFAGMILLVLTVVEKVTECFAKLMKGSRIPVWVLYIGSIALFLWMSERMGV